jgi:hypothetical protein
VAKISLYGLGIETSLTVLALRIPDEVISETRRATEILYLRFYYIA